MKEIVVIFMVLASSTAYAKSSQEIVGTVVRMHCKNLADDYSRWAHYFSKRVIHILDSTEANSKLRLDSLNALNRERENFIDEEDKKWKSLVQSPEAMDALVGTLATLTARFTTRIPLENIGKSEDWYQSQLFRECVK